LKGSDADAHLNAIGRKLLEVADVEEIVIQGSTRTRDVTELHDSFSIVIGRLLTLLPVA
jgi:hypothetical protein